MLAFTTRDEPDKAVIIMNTQTKEIIGKIPGFAAGVFSIALSPDGQYLAFSHGFEYYFVIYKLPEFSIIRFNKTEGLYFNALDITTNNEYIVAGASLALIRFLTTGLPESKEENDILYPNPANNTVDLNFDLPVTANLKFNLYEISGKFITELKSQFYSAGLIKEHLKLDNLSTGIYFLKAESLHFYKTFKIIIER